MADAYSKGYVANCEIDINGVRAFNAGAPVPDTHVSRGVVPKELVTAAAAEDGALDVSKLTVEQLREQLDARGLPVDGNKAELAARLSGAPAV